MSVKSETLNKLKGKLVVSCQAREGWAMYGTDIMTAFAMAAQEGGASAIRATGYDNIKAIMDKVDLPMIGINKIFNEGYDVYITPTYESAVEILELGIQVIAIDATPRLRPNNENFKDIIKSIRENYPDVLIMGEISNIEEARVIMDGSVDIISTTLSGYTSYTTDITSLNLSLIENIVKETDIPVIAEGKIASQEDAVSALKAGAFAVVVGTSITRPEIITKRYVEEIEKMSEKND